MAVTRLARFGVAAISTLLFVAAVVFYIASRTPSLQELQPNFNTVSPGVAQLIREHLAATANDPSNAEMWGELGMVLLAHQLDSDAATAFRNAITLNSVEFRWHYLHGLSIQSLDRVLAIQSFTEAASVAPANWLPPSRLAELYLADGNPDAAAKQIQIARQLSPQELRPALQEIRLLLQNKQAREAETLIQQLQTSFAPVRELFELTALCQHQLNRPLDAQATADSLARSNLPSAGWNDPYAAQVLERSIDPQDIFRRVQAFAADGQQSTAIQLLLDRSADMGSSLEYCTTLARLYLEVGRSKLARQTLETAAERFGSQSEIEHLLGVVDYSNGDYDTAQKHFSAAVQLRPDFALAIFNEAQCFVQRKQFTQAEDRLRASISASPEFEAARVALVEVLLEQQNNGEALRELEALRRINPENPQLTRLQQRLASASNEKAE